MNEVRGATPATSGLGARFSRSASLFERARRVEPGGTSRLTVYFPPHPVYFRRGQGCRLYDVDGNEYIDFINNYTSLIHGHAHPYVEAAAIAALSRGTAFAGPTEEEVRLAELLCDRLPAVEQIRFTNSGTEAVMMAIKAARAYTGKPAIAKIEGAYHGSYDYAEVSLSPPESQWGDPDRPNAVAYARGTPDSVLRDVIVLPFNRTEVAVKLLHENAHRLAAVLLDAMPARVGLIPPRPEFLQAIQDTCRSLGILLILDEVITLRLGYSGAQGAFGLDPDLTALGKIIGGGFPVGAVGGKREVMAVFDPVDGPPALPHGGTFSANPVTMAAGYAAMELLTEAEFARINDLGQRVRERLAEVIWDLGVEWQVTGAGSLFRLHPVGGQLVDYRSTRPAPGRAAKLAELHQGLLKRGLLIAPNGLGCLSTPMTDDEVAVLIGGVRDVLKAIEK